MDLSYLNLLPRQRGLLGVEKVTLAYTLFTAAIIGIVWPYMTSPLPLICGRAFILVGMTIAIALYQVVPTRATLLLRYIYPLSLLAYWYPDTYEFCQLIPNLDYLFAAADLALFGCQPSLTFHELLPSKLWSELFHLGYFSYYPMIAITVLVPLFTDRRRFGRTAFVVLTSFFLYYLIYLFLPVTGPQYYFHAIGVDAAMQGHLAHLGDYFRTHTAMLPSPGPDGFFRQLVESAQESGERPTAAFPSSHVGISTLLMIILWKDRRRKLWLILLPFYVLLCCATVYIEAHYFVDVIGGLITAFLFYWLTNRLYPHMEHIRF